MLSVRTCVACGAKKSPQELLRVALQKDAAPVFDAKKNAPGRGAWVCPGAQCIEQANKRRAFERALKTKMALPPNVKDELLHAVGATNQNTARVLADE